MKKWIIAIVAIIIIIFIFSLQRYNSPFDNLKIINQNVDIKNNKSEYEINVDCLELNDSNEQIVSYKLNQKYENSQVSISSKKYNSKNEEIENFNDIHSMVVKINIDKKNYTINAICK